MYAKLEQADVSTYASAGNNMDEIATGFELEVFSGPVSIKKVDDGLKIIMVQSASESDHPQVYELSIDENLLKFIAKFSD